MRRLAAAGLLALAAGCADPADPNRYYPPDDRARPALEAALAAWQRGDPPGQVPGATNPTVQMADTHRTPGQRLKAFAVLGVAPGNGPRVFTVRLTLENPDAELKARFVVVGIDPIWVFRQEDYDMLSHWDHPMPKDGKGKTTRSAN
jgi:hypothetical protein